MLEECLSLGHSTWRSPDDKSWNVEDIISCRSEERNGVFRLGTYLLGSRLGGQFSNRTRHSIRGSTMNQVRHVSFDHQVCLHFNSTNGEQSLPHSIAYRIGSQHWFLRWDQFNKQCSYSQVPLLPKNKTLCLRVGSMVFSHWQFLLSPKG